MVLAVAHMEMGQGCAGERGLMAYVGCGVKEINIDIYTVYMCGCVWGEGVAIDDPVYGGA